MVAEAVVGNCLKARPFRIRGVISNTAQRYAVLEAKYVEGSDSSKGLELYFSDEFKQHTTAI